MPTPTSPPKSRADLFAEFDALPPYARVSEILHAAVRGCSRDKLQRDRVYGDSIPFVREGGKLVTDRRGNTRIFGGRVYYIKQDILDYLAEKNQKITSTSEISARARGV